jgi:small-conductance mechanosensitive channel
MKLQQLLKQDYAGNSMTEYGLAAVTFLVVLWAFLYGRRLVIGRLRDLAKLTETDLDDLAVEILGKIKAPECYLVAFYASTRSLAVHARFDGWLRTAVILIVAYRIVTMLQSGVKYAIHRTILADGADLAHRETAQNLTLAAQALIWLGAVLFTMSNLGFNVSSMIAGLGITGIAVALAAQAVLGDLFSAFAIYLDKPFVVGDAIKVGDAVGTVEHIGIKTTRVRSVTGETLVFPNSSLTSSRIQNYREMAERRVLFRFGLLYSTPAKDLAELPEAVKAIVAKDAALRFERAHLAELGDSALTFEVVYHVMGNDYTTMMDAQQRILLELMAEVKRRGLDFAFPTRTVHLSGKA